MNEVEQNDEGANAQRAARAAATVDAYMAHDSDDDCVLTDMLADLMHHARVVGEDFESALDSARSHFLAELEEDK